MPNHCINEVIFRDDRCFEDVRRFACNSDGLVDFRVLLPIPLNVWVGSVGFVHEKAFGKCGLDWSTTNWGTKWNAYNPEPITRDAAGLTLRFQTAWRPPYGWLVAMFNVLKVGFEHNWLSEGHSRGVHGVFDYAKLEGPGVGHPWLETEAPDPLHRHLHDLLFGIDDEAPG